MKGKSNPIPVYTESESFNNACFPDFYISSYEDPEFEYDNRIIPHRHTYYEVIMVIEGEGNHIIDFTEYDFCGPCIFLLQPGHVHQIQKCTPTKGYVIKFSESFFDVDSSSENLLVKYEIFDNIQSSPVLHPERSLLPAFTDLINLMIDEQNKAECLSRIILESYLKVLLLKISKIKLKGVDTYVRPQQVAFRNFKKMLEDNYQKQHAPAFYAAILNTSVASLSRLAYELTGKTVKELINDRIILEAKRQLYNGEMTVKEIAFHLGFDDPAYFTRFFTKQQNISPRGFGKSE